MTRDVASVGKRMEQLVREYQRIEQRARAAEQRQVEEYRTRLAILAERYAQAKPAPPKPLTIAHLPGSLKLPGRWTFVCERG